jgi:hypothetical protein
MQIVSCECENCTMLPIAAAQKALQGSRTRRYICARTKLSYTYIFYQFDYI